MLEALNVQYICQALYQLTSDHVWTLFVLHESILMCTQNNTELIVPPGSKTVNIACQMKKSFFAGPVFVIPGAMEHSCSDCHKPF